MKTTNEENFAHYFDPEAEQPTAASLEEVLEAYDPEIAPVHEDEEGSATRYLFLRSIVLFLQLSLIVLFLLLPVFKLPVWFCFGWVLAFASLSFRYLDRSEKLVRDFFFSVFVKEKSYLQKFNRRFFWQVLLLLAIASFSSVFTFASIFINGWIPIAFMLLGIGGGSLMSEMLFPFIGRHFRRRFSPLLFRSLRFGCILVFGTLMAFLGDFFWGDFPAPNMSPGDKVDTIGEIEHAFKPLEIVARLLSCFEMWAASLAEAAKAAGHSFIALVIKLLICFPNPCTVIGSTMVFKSMSDLLSMVWEKTSKAFTFRTEGLRNAHPNAC